MPISPGDPIYAFRRQLAHEITRSLGPMAQHCIAPDFGIPQPRMSELGRGLVDRCSVEWLIRRIYRLGGSVTITVALGDAQREWTARQFARRGQRQRRPPREPRLSANREQARLVGSSQVTLIPNLE
jgi:predicted XRE-type DNA-binding protein